MAPSLLVKLIKRTGSRTPRIPHLHKPTSSMAPVVCRSPLSPASHRGTSPHVSLRATTNDAAATSLWPAQPSKRRPACLCPAFFSLSRCRPRAWHLLTLSPRHVPLQACNSDTGGRPVRGPFRALAYRPIEGKPPAERVGPGARPHMPCCQAAAHVTPTPCSAPCLAAPHAGAVLSSRPPFARSCPFAVQHPTHTAARRVPCGTPRRRAPAVHARLSILTQQ
jgi:hypothetical protein